MRKWLMGASVLGAAVLASVAPAAAHGGGLDSLGCHNDKRSGGYHCHRGTLAGKYFSSKSQAFEALRGRQSSYLTSPSAAAPPVKSSVDPDPAVSRAELVRATQYLLTSLGYEPGPADGEVGTATTVAIRAFQKDHAIVTNGEVSGALLVKLSEIVLARR